MGRIVQPQATRGSQYWLQTLIATAPQRLDEAIGLGTLEWLSPLGSDDFAEYRDAGFLDRLGVELTKRPLDTFWPSSGPVWDGLARTPWGASILVEAKSHVSEMSSDCAAESPQSRVMIESALRETKEAFDVDADIDWCTDHYQYANRLAHAYLMNELNAVPTELAFVYFVGDSEMNGPATRKDWESVVITAHDRLGVLGQLPRYVRDVFVDVSIG